MKFKLINLIRKDCLWTSNGYRDQTKDFDIPASQKDWTKYPDSSWAGVLVDATNRVGCYYVVNIAAKTERLGMLKFQIISDNRFEQGVFYVYRFLIKKSWWFAQINLNTKNTHLF